MELTEQRKALAWFKERLGLQIGRSLLHPALIAGKKGAACKVWYCQTLEEKFHILHTSGEYEELTPLEFTQRIICRFHIHHRTDGMKYSWGNFDASLGCDEDGYVFFTRE